MIGSARTSAGLRVVGAEEGELVLRGRNLIKIGAEESGGAFSFWLGTLPRGKGPPLHVHEFEDETFFILDGEFEILLASQAIRSGPGTCVFFPRQRPHTFRSVTPTGRALLLATPGDGLVSFFRAVGDADSETREGMLLRERLGRQYGLSFLREGAELPPVNGARPYFYGPAKTPPAPRPGEVVVVPRLTADDSGGVIVEEVWTGAGAAWLADPRPSPGAAYVAAGEFEVGLNGERRRVGPGATVFIPSEGNFAWTARGEGPGRMLRYTAPAAADARLSSRP